MGTVSNMQVEPCKALLDGTDLGFTEGDIEITLEEMGVELTAHQEGTNVLDMIRTGKKAELTLTLKETSIAQLKTLIEAGGSVLGAVSGWGSKKDFTGMLNDAKALVLHPVTRAVNDLVADLTFPKAYPMLSSIVQSGENPKTVSVTFKIFPDLTADAETRLFSYGDTGA